MCLLLTVGERVKNVREVSKGGPEPGKDELEKAKRYIVELEQNIQNLQHSNKNGTVDQSELRKKLQDTEKQLDAAKKNTVKLEKSVKSSDEGLVKKETALKNTMGTLAEKLKQIKQLNDQLTEKDQEIKKAGGKDTKELVTLRMELAQLRKQNKEKDDKIKLLETRDKSSGSGGASSASQAALIDKLKKTIKQQKTMLDLKQKEIELIKDGIGDEVIDLE
eukprot:TRINITY_DN4379_c0_g1_i1.p1 TRINITY_DN4379_c0_g1~~TRINITY_DN4379_c0_g1_i1.p1  ORF type:complete len:220 (+),score=66.36 TRINITY_DN4379_c0_g1_i1:73-732(+)